MCLEVSPQTESSDPVFFITEVLLLPLFLSVGLVGCPLLLIILSRRPMLAEDSIYVYLSGLASSDLVLFCSSVPRFVRGVDALPLTDALSRPMAYALLVGQGLEPACRHAAIWLTALTVAARAVGVRFRRHSGTEHAENERQTEKARVRERNRQKDRDTLPPLPPPPPPPPPPLSPSMWSKVRVGRVLVFFVFLSCFLLNITRFLDSEVVQVTESRCRESTSPLWTQNLTRLGLDATHRRVRSVVVCFVGHVIPLTVTAVFVLTLACTSNFCCHRRRFCLTTPKNRTEREFLVNAFVLSISTSLLILETPSAFLAVFEACFDGFFGHSSLHHFRLVSRCLGLLRPVLGIILTALINHGFRKTCKRTFCCCGSNRRKHDGLSNRVICCCHGYRKSDADVADKANDVRLGDGTKTKNVVCGTKNRRQILDNAYDDVKAFKPNLRPKSGADMGMWI